MRPSPYFYLGLAVFFVAALAVWFIGLQTLGEYLWRILNIVPRP